MDGSARIDRDLRLLDSIVAGLLVLAGVAAWAAAAPRPARWAVLCVLRRADVRAKDFVCDYPYRMGLPPRPFVTTLDGGGPAAALSLALSLRVLALAIRDMVARLRRRQFLSGDRPVSGSRMEGRPSPTPRGPGLARALAPLADSPDTS